MYTLSCILSITVNNILLKMHHMDYIRELKGNLKGNLIVLDSYVMVIKIT